jgi:hypothetical protein
MKQKRKITGNNNIRIAIIKWTENKYMEILEPLCTVNGNAK